MPAPCWRIYITFRAALCLYLLCICSFLLCLKSDFSCRKMDNWGNHLDEGHFSPQFYGILNKSGFLQNYPDRILFISTMNKHSFVSCSPTLDTHDHDSEVTSLFYVSIHSRQFPLSSRPGQGVRARGKEQGQERERPTNLGLNGATHKPFNGALIPPTVI